MLEEEYRFCCPYCSSDNSIEIDLTGGRVQSFTYDCEVCCAPMEIKVESDQTGILSFIAEKAA